MAVLRKVFSVTARGALMLKDTDLVSDTDDSVQSVEVEDLVLKFCLFSTNQ